MQNKDIEKLIKLIPLLSVDASLSINEIVDCLNNVRIENQFKKIYSHSFSGLNEIQKEALFVKPSIFDTPKRSLYYFASLSGLCPELDSQDYDYCEGWYCTTPEEPVYEEIILLFFVSIPTRGKRKIKVFFRPQFFHKYGHPPYKKEEERFCRFAEKLIKNVKAEIERTFSEEGKTKEIMISENVLSKIPSPLPKIWHEIEGCYRHGYFCACSILLRKILEIAIHKKFKKSFGNDSKLRSKEGNLFSLKTRMDIARQNQFISSSLAKELKAIKWFGDVGAHQDNITLTESDVKPNMKLMRLILEEIFSK